jgi:homocitrate synthase
VERFGTPDTVGVATPAAVRERVSQLRTRYPDIDLEGHFHDDRGFALVNALEAVNCGMRYINTSLLGIGERSGITSMTALLFNLYIDKMYDHLEGYTLRSSYPINVMFASKLRKLVPSKEPVSLTNRTHTAGVHQKAVLNALNTYEPFSLDQFGVSESEMLLGPLSGWNMIYYYLKEIKYYNLGESTARKIAKVFKERMYNLGPNDSPTAILIDIAENEFGLSHLALPGSVKDNIFQRLDEHSTEVDDAELNRQNVVSLKRP